MPGLTSDLQQEYEQLWSTCEIDYQPDVANSVANKLISNKERYQHVSDLTGVPWYWIAVVHQRESGGDFRGVLHNGEFIIGTGKKTRLVPANRGPFDSWEDAAIDALEIKGLSDKSIEWGVGKFFYEMERFNGFGYRNKGVPSPYLWSHTNHYKDSDSDDDAAGGKYVADHVYDPDAHDKQPGTAAVLKAMQKYDPSILGTESKPVTSGVPIIPLIVIAGGLIAAIYAGIRKFFKKGKKKNVKNIKKHSDGSSKLG